MLQKQWISPEVPGTHGTFNLWSNDSANEIIVWKYILGTKSLTSTKYKRLRGCDLKTCYSLMMSPEIKTSRVLECICSW